MSATRPYTVKRIGGALGLFSVNGPCWYCVRMGGDGARERAAMLAGLKNAEFQRAAQNYARLHRSTP